MLDMGDFAGGLLKYLKKPPIPRLTLGGGFGKFSKLARGHLDLHSGRSQVDFEWLTCQLESLGASGNILETSRQANTAAEVLELASNAGIQLGDRIAQLARDQALKKLHAEMSAMTYDERVDDLGLKPDRADVILPAGEIYMKVMSLAKCKGIIVPKVGLSDGIILGLYRSITG